jgi:hypothetical protein
MLLKSLLPFPWSFEFKYQKTHREAKKRFNPKDLFQVVLGLRSEMPENVATVNDN